MLDNRFCILQEEQIRLGKEHGLSRSEIRLYANPKYNFRKMEEMRLRLERKEKIRSVEKARPYLHWGKKGIGVLGVCLFLGKAIPKEKPSLELKESRIVIKQGEIFEPMKYVESCSKNGVLVLPKDVSTDTPGDRVAVYRLEDGKEVVERLMYIHVE